MFTISYDLMARGSLISDLDEREAGTYMSREEKRALRQAEAAEEAFRASHGYPPATFWGRVRRALFRK